MSPEEKKAYKELVIYNIEQHLNKLPMVRWDRYTTTNAGIDTRGNKIKRFEVYGWIERKGDTKRKDFILMTFDFNAAEGSHTYGFTTSSAIHSKEISMLLSGHDTTPHHSDCIRVEKTFTNVNNAIKLKGKS